MDSPPNYPLPCGSLLCTNARHGEVQRTKAELPHLSQGQSTANGNSTSRRPGVPAGPKLELDFGSGLYTNYGANKEPLPVRAGSWVTAGAHTQGKHCSSPKLVSLFANDETL